MPDFLQHLSDEELVRSYRSSADKRVVGELFKRNSLLCFAVCNKYLKNEEAAQDALMQIFEDLFVLLLKHEVSNFRSWLHSVARNHCLMQLRKPQLFERLYLGSEENEDSLMEFDPALHPTYEQAEMEFKLKSMEEAMEQLNEKQKQCLKMFYLKQMSYEEIASESKLSLNEVKSAIQNGKRNLKIKLAEKGITYLLAMVIWIKQSA